MGEFPLLCDVLNLVHELFYITCGKCRQQFCYIMMRGYRPTRNPTSYDHTMVYARLEQVAGLIIGKKSQIQRRDRPLVDRRAKYQQA